jgi:hypothetical protein
VLLPRAVKVAFHADVAVSPAGSVNTMVQLGTAAAVLFVTVYEPSKPEPQSLVLANAAVRAPAACAEVASNVAAPVRLIAPAVASAAAFARRRLCGNTLLLLWRWWCGVSPFG